MKAWETSRRIITVLVLIGLVVAAGVAVFRVPLQSIFVLGVALTCPLLMFGMHAGGHGHGARHGGASSPTHVGHDVSRSSEHTRWTDDRAHRRTR